MAVALVILLAGLLDGCASKQATPHPSLRQIETRVAPKMVIYRNAAYRGSLTQAEQERVNSAYADYEAAFTQARTQRKICWANQ
jgi:hypothetical protein